ncbi:hypothetical protein HNR00_000782 [Methylorubrum rhodinum]|uniref:Type II secretion system protein GspC N-terminal domain-containing protein n=1 Tax=Methylorubrum rhodinum TaxID=29428 RepID=A0A840ZER4_9HYPH|nr:hypothetical protein [Methylorubrum rhodinum]MBB5756086.1 hypothetical protein [Methylorubrum rhodinum]
MRPALPALPPTGLLPRVLFGLAAAAALAAFAWPVRIDPAPEPPAIRAEPPGEAALRRPLFDPGRREWTARGSRETVAEGDPPRPVLIVRGIRLDGAAASALIDDGSGDRIWLRTGEGRADWRVVAIAADHVTVDQRGRAFTAAFMGPPATLRPKPLDAGLRR